MALYFITFTLRYNPAVFEALAEKQVAQAA